MNGKSAESSSMHGKIALPIAAGLALAGALLNWIYLDTKAQQLEKIEFLCVASGATIRPGERFTEDKLAPLAIPKNNVGENLADEAIKYDDRGTVIGMAAVRLHREGEIILRQDLKTPPATLTLNKDKEVAIFIPVDTRTFIPSLVSAGDLVSFMVGGVPTPAAPPDTDGSGDENGGLPAMPSAPGNAELIGPFKVLSLGNRLGSAEVLKASGLPQMQENVMTISAEVTAGQLDPKAAKLWKLLQANGFRQVGVVLHARPSGASP
ncbi:MAG: hypothetical protein L0211_07640 [Planctomycetaceae bacterium]|nr:hypothetical protein [Planctomycetaceae bacterium]